MRRKVGMEKGILPILLQIRHHSLHIHFDSVQVIHFGL